MNSAFAAAGAALLAGLAASFAPSPSRADQPIVVQSQRHVAPWIVAIESDLHRNLRDTLQQPYARQMGVDGGLAGVSFVRGDDGRPTAVRLSRASGDAALDRVAMRSVARLRSIGTPLSGNSVKRFRAYIIVAPDRDTYADYAAVLAQEEGARVRGTGADASEVALVVTVPPSA